MGRMSFEKYLQNATSEVLVAEFLFHLLSNKYNQKRISEVSRTTSGGTPLRSVPEYYDGNIPWLKSGELNDSIIYSASESITDLGLENSSAKIFPKGTLLVAMYGATVGKVGILDIDASSNQAICAIFPNENQVERDYLYWFFRSMRFKYISLSRGGAQPNISQSVINKTLIPLPEKEIQTRVVRFLSVIENDGKLELSFLPLDIQRQIKEIHSAKLFFEEFNNVAKHQLSLLKKLRQAVLQEAVEGKLTADWRTRNPEKITGENSAERLLETIQEEKEKLIAQGKIKKQKPLPPITDDDKPFDLPPGWLWVRLGDVCDFITKGTTPPTSELKEKGDIPFLKVYNVRNKRIDFLFKPQFISKEVHDRLGRSKVLPGDIVMNIVGPPLGKVAIIPDDFPEWNINQALAIFRPLVQTMNKFLFYFLSGGFDIHSIQTLGVVGQDNISLLQCREIIFPLIPLAEQKVIVERVERLLAMVDELEGQVGERKEYAGQMMQSVLKEAFNHRA